MSTTVETTALDRLQSVYQSAAADWITAIQHEAHLASGIHSEAQLDLWESAAFADEIACRATKEAKKAYEDALRQEFFNF
jgi:hypothetical protein